MRTLSFIFAALHISVSLFAMDNFDFILRNESNEPIFFAFKNDDKVHKDWALANTVKHCKINPHKYSMLDIFIKRNNQKIPIYQVILPRHRSLRLAYSEDGSLVSRATSATTKDEQPPKNNITDQELRNALTYRRY